ncbi:Cof-type HAD-IIB family hydrolase [Jeotgalibacillus proteolyticus]|uniref:Cof-type HAD-IIB family hydrolase n=1 Tax=Jeotgalibacillus proteolyticus TaxID=2082395 RepID=A0A2S5G9P4_9BACL|nr:Cof-type HAD-IIB family hydrolase [Jeotgalibacillus proteolyticus]PPA69720.1 Cof-type HAD-IIB family hydrolase [Jeotgalibacillus proteolyticus]
MIKLLASDMDGTLLNKDHVVGPENSRAIKEAQAQGVEVVVATGRSYLEAMPPLKEAGITCPIISVNGAEIRDANGEQLLVRGIDKETAKDAAQQLENLDIYFEVYTNKGTFTNDKEQGIQLLIDIFLTTNPDTPLPHVETEAQSRYDEGHIEVVEGYEQIFNDETQTIYKFLAFSSNPEALEKVNAILQKTNGLAISSSGRENLEITSLDAQKGIALEWYCNKKGISLKDVMAIGDNYNDLSMMKKAGYSVAMGNAPDDIKEQCAHITATNREDGVAKAIEHLVTVQSV